MRSAGERDWAEPLLFLLAGALLLFCSGTSPLYVVHDWTDPNTYLTMGRGLLHGAVPYRDLFDHKGPLLYAVFALGALIDPRGFTGVFLLQILSLGAALRSLYRLGLLVTGRGRAFLCAAALPVFLLSAGVYYLPDRLDYGGASAEEFCLPLIAGALYLSARCEAEGRWSRGRWALLGLTMGCVVQIKFTIALFWVGLLAPVLLGGALRRQWSRLARGVGWGLLGLGGSLVPYLLYGAATGSLDDFARAYFQFNLSYARGDAAGLPALLARTAAEGLGTLRDIPVLAAALALLCLGLPLLKGLPARWRLSVLGGFGGLALAIWAGRVMPYALLPLLLAAHGGLLGMASRLPPWRLWERAGTKLLLAGVLVLLAALQNQMYAHKPLAWSGERTCQEEVAELVRAGPWEEPTILEAGMLSRGFYNQLGQVPRTRFFYLPNVTYSQHPEILDSQRAAILRRETDYVILQSGQPALNREAMEPGQAMLYQAVRGGYEERAVVRGTGAVDHLYYHIFMRKERAGTVTL